LGVVHRDIKPANVLIAGELVSVGGGERGEGRGMKGKREREGWPMCYVYALGVMRRDIKPANLLLDPVTGCKGKGECTGKGGQGAGEMAQAGAEGMEVC
jgi:serine/threonine protein kinase